jgi:tRNA pseudouridine55 synthase
MDGVLIIDKPAGLTSHDVVARVRRTIGERRVGHTGTLDPFATGVLVILVGRATRLAQFLSGAEKEYQAIVRLGFATDTGDITGKPLPSVAGLITPETTGNWSELEIEAALQGLRGEIEQVPPMYSAKKQGGRKLYELARRGEEVEREAVSVTIHTLEIDRNAGRLLTDNQDGTVDIRIRVLCSAGTYVRTLAEDFGRRLGVGAHLTELRRTKAGDFSIDSALSLERLQECANNKSLEKVFVSPDAALARLPYVSLNASDVRRTQQGMPLQLGSDPAGVSPTSENVRMRDETGTLIAVGAYDRAAAVIRPRVVLTIEG